MKALLLKSMIIFLALFSFNVFAQTTVKYTISGEPVVVTGTDNVYVLPDTSTYTPTSDYYYITTGSTKRVCYREVQTGLMSPTSLSLRIGADTVAVNCYDYSPDYFIIK